MKKPIIGIVPTLSYKVGPGIFDDHFQFVNNYVRKIEESGGLAYGLLMGDGVLNHEILDVCDGFLIPGGSQIRKYVYEILHYAIKNDVPILGVCLGAQAMSVYSALIEKTDNKSDLTYDEIVKVYNELKAENEGTVLRELPKDNIHAHNGLTREQVDEARHPIRIMQGSLLHDIYQNTELNVASFHGYDFKFVGNGFVAPAYAMDGVKEAIEYYDPNRFVLGVHFHPELDENNKIFDRLVSEAAKRKR